MSWFDTSGLTNLAKNALKEAQKTIDKALDIQDESGDEQEEEEPPKNKGKALSGTNTPQKDSSDFFSSWGLTVSAESDKTIKEQPVVTESPSKSSSQGVWGSFAGSFFEQPSTSDSTIVRPPKAKSMNLIADAKYGSQDDLFSKSQLVMSDGESMFRNVKSVGSPKEERRGSSRSNMLSLVSSQNSSDSVEVLSQSLKSTPDSEVSASMSHSSSAGQKLNSESVEIVPDSLVSPSSIECLGFDSNSEKNSSSSSNLSPDVSDKKSTPIGERTERVGTADSVSLVADDDEDTMSYNSVSECTAPTVLDTDEKAPFTRPIRTEPQRKVFDKELILMEQPLPSLKMQLSENSSNDGSWSDRTLNADNDSNTEAALEEQKKEIDHEDVLIEKLSDSSSFYDVNPTDMLRSESSAFVNIDKHSNDDSCESSQKDGSLKERISPISSDSKSDLVKIGSDRTSGHTSGDEIETATSSDIEIIPSPNGDNGHSYCRNSPAKYAFKQSKFDGTTSPHLVDLVLGKSLATKIRGHNRELSEASVQSNTSDESQGSENDRLLRRLCEMTEILDARENRLMEVSRNNVELAESNADLKTQLEMWMAKHEPGDINSITEDYTQRMSALEKKFQQAIREKDNLRKQLDVLKSESATRKLSSEFENSLKEKDDVIAQLQEEGEKLARQELQHSNIIKKLRVKEKDNEQVIKSLRDKIADLTSELDRVRRSMSAKEEVEVSQIEAVYRLTTANKKMDAELMETRGALDDTLHRLESTRTSLDAARRELSDLQRGGAELQRRAAALPQLEADRREAEARAERMRRDVTQLRAELAQEEKRWLSREDALRRELSEARELCASLEARAEAASEAGSGALLPQLAALQRSALEREQAHSAAAATLAARRAEAEASLAKAIESERLSREETQALQERLASCEAKRVDTSSRLEAMAVEYAECQENFEDIRLLAIRQTNLLENLKSEYGYSMTALSDKLTDAETLLERSENALLAEKRRNALLQDQLAGRVDVSPPHSVASESLPAALWDDRSVTPVCLGAGAGAGEASASSAACEERTLSLLKRREGELRAAGEAGERARAERDAARARLAAVQAELDECRTVQEQYDALLVMYGEAEERLVELRHDLDDVTQLYKAQLDELVALKQQAKR